MQFDRINFKHFSSYKMKIGYHDYFQFTLADPIHGRYLFDPDWGLWQL